MVAWLLMAAAQTAQPAFPPPPSTAAMALARAASERPVPPEVLDRAVDGIARGLLQGQAAWRGAGCDPEVPACRQAAERLARETAPAALAEHRETHDGWLALVIEDTMTAAEIAQALAFVQTSAGRSFAYALTRLSAPAELSPALRRKLSLAMMNPPASTTQRGLVDRFYDMTAGLPRRTLPLIPPPPMPSPPARKS